MHKHSGGTIAWGWVNNDQTGTFIDCCYTDFYSQPGAFGMGGYIKAYVAYEYDAASYLQFEAWA